MTLGVIPSPKVLWCVTDTFPKTGYATAFTPKQTKNSNNIGLIRINRSIITNKKGLAMGPRAGKGTKKKNGELHLSVLVTAHQKAP